MKTKYVQLHDAHALLCEFEQLQLAVVFFLLLEIWFFNWLSSILHLISGKSPAIHQSLLHQLFLQLHQFPFHSLPFVASCYSTFVVLIYDNPKHFGCWCLLILRASIIFYDFSKQTPTTFLFMQIAVVGALEKELSLTTSARFYWPFIRPLCYHSYIIHYVCDRSIGSVLQLP